MDHSQFIIASPYFAGAAHEDPQQRDLFLEQIPQLSPEELDILTSEKTADYLWTLGQNNNFSEEQITALAKVVRKMITGEITKEYFSSEIAQKVRCEQEYADELVRFLTQDILAPVLQAGPAPSSQTIPSQDIGKNNIIDLRKLSE